MNFSDGMGGACLDDRFSLGLSPISEPKNWENAVPAGAKEFTLLLSKGMIRPYNE